MSKIIYEPDYGVSTATAIERAIGIAAAAGEPIQLVLRDVSVIVFDGHAEQVVNAWAQAHPATPVDLTCEHGRLIDDCRTSGCRHEDTSAPDMVNVVFKPDKVEETAEAVIQGENIAAASEFPDESRSGDLPK